MNEIIITAVDSDGEESACSIKPSPEGLTVIVAQQGIHVKVPSFVEIDIRKALACLEQMHQAHWQHISQGHLFQILFYLVFDGKIRPSEKLVDLLDGDMGVQHMAGGIILACEAFFAGKNVFWRNPENSLHPASEQRFMMMIQAMLGMCGIRQPKGFVREYMEEAAKKIYGADALKAMSPEDQEIEDVKQTIGWLETIGSLKGLNYEFGSLDNCRLTIGDMLSKVKCMSPVGKRIIQIYKERRDGDFKSVAPPA